jgi:outer membrane murein-binding lipoprotein Lpp
MRVSMGVVLAGALFVASSLAGCASRDVQDLQDEVDRLERLVEALNTDVEDMRDNLEMARADVAAARADLDHAGVALMVVVFGPAGDNRTWTDLVPFDERSRPSTPAYAAQGVAHADAYTVHDLMTEWATSHGHRFNATWFSFDGGGGYFVTDIAGVVGESSFWSLSINSRATAVGMSEALVTDGDTVTWTLTAFGPL